jgi:hypothetical protein
MQLHSYPSPTFPGHSFQMLFLDKEENTIYFRHILPAHWAIEAKRAFLEYALDLKKEGYNQELDTITETEIAELLFTYCVVNVAPTQEKFTVLNRSYSNLTDLIEKEFDTPVSPFTSINFCQFMGSHMVA